MSTGAEQLALSFRQGELKEQITIAHHAIGHYGRMAVTAARDCGQLLSELKKLLKDKQWRTYKRKELPFSEATRKNYTRIYQHWDTIDSLPLNERPTSIKQALRLISEKTNSNESNGDGGSNGGNKPVKKPVKAIIHTKAKEEITSILENSSLKNKGKLKAIKKFLESKELHYSLKLDEEEAASSDSRKAQPPAEVNDGEAASSDSHSAQPSAEVNGAIGASSDSHSAQPPAEVNGGEAASGDSRKAPTTC